MPDSTDHDGHAEPSGHGAAGAHEPPKMVEASLDSPQFQVAAANPERVERGIAVMFVLGVVGFAGFGAAFWQNWSNVWLGVTLAVGFFGLGIGMVAWGKYLMPRGPFSESRRCRCRSRPVARSRAACSTTRLGRRAPTSCRPRAGMSTSTISTRAAC